MSPDAGLPRLTPRARLQLVLLGVFATLMLVPVTLPVPVLRGLVQDRFGVSDLQTAVFMSINMVGAFLMAPIAGAVADRFGKHKAPIVLALGVDALCFWGLTMDVPFGAFLIVRFCEGCAHIFALSLLLSLAAAQGKDLGRGRVMGVVGAGITLGVALGAPIGGVLGREFGALFPVHVGGALLAVTGVLFGLMIDDAGSERVRPGFREILRIANADRALLVPLAYAFVDRFTVGFFTTTFPLFMRRVHDLPVDRIGLLLGLFLGPFCLLSYPFGRLSERTSRVRLVVGGSLVYGLFLSSLGFWSLDGLYVLMPLLGILSAVMFVPSLMLTAELASAEIRSTALGAFNAAGSLGFIVGPLVGGFVSQSVAASSDWPTGYSAAFGVAGVSEVVCVLLTLPLIRRLLRERRVV